MLMVRGGSWIRYDDADPVAVDEGDVANFRGPDHYVVSDAVDTEPSVTIHPGQVCTDLEGTSLAASMTLGTRTWGTSVTGSSVVLTATYTGDGEVSDRLLTALPRLVVLRSDEWHCPYVDLLLAESTRPVGPGGGARPPAGPGTHRGAANLVRPARDRLAGLVRRPDRPDRGAGTGAAPRGAIPSLDGRRARGRGGRVPCRARPTLHRAGRRAADDLPHGLAPRTRRRPPARADRDRQRRRPRRRLPEPVHVQHRVQAPVRLQPQRAPRPAPRTRSGNGGGWHGSARSAP